MAPTSLKTYMEFFQEHRPSIVSPRQRSQYLLTTFTTQGPSPTMVQLSPTGCATANPGTRDHIEAKSSALALAT